MVIELRETNVLTALPPGLFKLMWNEKYIFHIKYI